MTPVTDAAPHHAPHHSEATLRRRRALSLTWAGLAIGWAFVRALVAWAALGRYGLNPWVYLSIDLASACVDAYTTPKMVIAFVDRQYKRAAAWGVASLVAFVVPDLYLFLDTGKLPRKVIYIMIAIIGVMFSLAVVGVVRKVRKARAERLSLLIDERLGADAAAERPA